ncbi:MAG: hypothetical protein GX334_07115 [Firmicutes bacterium]|nr:hypothetical protein [Bacillota bacterium]
MREKFKGILLIFLVMCSMGLTYRLWFGRPPLEEGTAPRYEYAYFTPLPPLSEVVRPKEIIFCGGEKPHLYRRGEEEYRRLWSRGRRTLAQVLDPEKMKRCSSEELEAAREKAAFKLVYAFDPPFPLEFSSERLATTGVDARVITFLWGKDSRAIFMEGNEIYGLPLPEEAWSQDEFLPTAVKPGLQLPPVLVLNVVDEQAGETGCNSFETAETPGETGSLSLGIAGNAGTAQGESYEIRVSGEIFIEEEGLTAAEIMLEKEDLQREELVKAFFLDLSMARRIEEKDGAFYYTNGEKGLRIYTSGLVEFTAPRLDSSLQQRMPYSQALQKGIENLSLYGGCPPSAYLCAARNSGNGYRLSWCQVTDGLVWVGENAGCEIVLNEQGVTFYRRNFPVAGAEIAARRPFRPYEDALRQAVCLYRDELPGKKATLLSLRPVYYLTAGKNGQAVPAWAVDFAETGVIYLHWSTLKPL